MLKVCDRDIYKGSNRGVCRNRWKRDFMKPSHLHINTEPPLPILLPIHPHSPQSPSVLASEGKRHVYGPAAKSTGTQHKDNTMGIGSSISPVQQTNELPDVVEHANTRLARFGGGRTPGPQLRQPTSEGITIDFF